MNRLLICLFLLPVFTYGQADSTAAPADTVPTAAKQDTVAKPIATPAPSAAGQVAAKASSASGATFEGIISYRIKVRGLGKNIAKAVRDTAQYPTRQITLVQGSAMRMYTEGAIFNSTALYTAGGERFVLDSAAQTAYDTGKWPKDLTLIRQTKQETIAGHPARLYLVQRKASAGKPAQVVQRIWFAEDLKVAADSTGNYPYPKLANIPLRIIASDGKLETVIEATEIKAAEQPAELFFVPGTWTIKPHNPIYPLGGMGGNRKKAGE